MSHYGMEILTESGRLWMSPDVTPMNLIKKENVNIFNGYEYATSVPVGTPAMVFLKYQNVDTSYYVKQKNTNGFLSYIFVGSPKVSNVTIYLFACLVPVTSTWGINFYNESGKVAYNTEMIPLEFHEQVYEKGDIRTKYFYGESVAVNPTMYRCNNVQDPGGTGSMLRYVFAPNASNDTISIALSYRRNGRGVELSQQKVFYIKTSVYD